jgi:hypothetical protein
MRKPPRREAARSPRVRNLRTHITRDQVLCVRTCGSLTHLQQRVRVVRRGCCCGSSARVHERTCVSACILSRHKEASAHTRTSRR